MNGSGEIITLPEKKYPNNEAQSRNSPRQDFANSARKQSSCILTSRKGAQKVSAAACIISDEHVSSDVIFDGSLRKFDGSNSKKPNYNSSEQHVSVKSNISSEVELPLIGDKNEQGTRTVLEKNLNCSENGLSSITHDTQTDSSCSNSYVTHPVYSSRNNIKSTEAKKFMQQNFSSSASAPTSFISCVEDPVTISVASGLAGQIAQTSVDNFKTGVNTEALGMMMDQNSSSENTLHPSTCSRQLRKYLGAPIEIRTDLQGLDHALGAPNNVAIEIRQHLKNHPDKLCGGVNCSGNHSENCSAETDKESHLCVQSESCNHFCRKGEDNLHIQSSTRENRSSLTSQQEFGGMNPAKNVKFSGGLKSPACSLTGCEIEQKTAVVSILNLNEEIRQLDDPKNSNGESTPSIKVIRVVAKSGVPLPLSMTVSSLKFEGRLDWRGAAATSAFRPASSPNRSDWNTSSMHKDDLILNDTKRVMEIDLNVAPTEDFSSVELPCENEITSGASILKSSSNNSSKAAGKFEFDLNLLGNNADECPQSSFSVKLGRFSPFCLNLNEDPRIGGATSGAHSHIQNGELIGRKKVESAACPVFSRDQDLQFVRLGSGGDMNSTHNFSHGLGQPFLVATPIMQQTAEHIHRIVPLQSKLPYAVQMLPSHSYSSNGPFYICPASSVPSNNFYASMVPSTRDTHAGVIFPQVLNSGSVSAFHGAPYLVNVPQGQSPGGVMKTQTRYDIDNEEVCLMNGSRKGNARQFFPIQSTEEQMKVHQQPPLNTMPMKRREPEGGYDSFQSGYKHTTSTR